MKLKLALYGWAHYYTTYHIMAYKDEQFLRHMRTQPVDMCSNSHTIQTGLVAHNILRKIHVHCMYMYMCMQTETHPTTCMCASCTCLVILYITTYTLQSLVVLPLVYVSTLLLYASYTHNHFTP